MKRKSLFLRSSVALLAMGSLAGCAGSSADSSTIVVWVGSESVEYYRALADQFLAENADFGYNISIIGADTGGAAGQMVADNTACGDIVTIAHDNIGKLSQLTYIVPIVDSGESSKKLLEQIDADNPKSFLTVIKNILGSDETYSYTFAAPYISQALFLYYDTRYISDTQAESFEGLIEAAKAYDASNGVSGTKSYTVTGTDGYNMSFQLLARNITNGNTSSLRLYENGEGKSSKAIRYDSYAQDNEQVAIAKWMQRNFKDPNGALLDQNDSPWATNIEQHKALSLIGGAWHYNSFKKAVTDENGKVHMGCKILPTFTLTEADVEGITEVTYPNDEYLPENLRGSTDPVPAVGTVMRGGSFVDCKCFVINTSKIANAKRYYKLCEIIKYFTTKQAQNESFLKALNVPAYAGSEAYIEEVKDQIDETAYLMASAQTGMNVYGIPQPFVTGALNTYYYSKNAPDYYLQCIKNTGNAYTNVDDIRKVLFRMEYVWKHGGSPSAYPSAFPEETSSRR